MQRTPKRRNKFSEHGETYSSPKNPADLQAEDEKIVGTHLLYSYNIY